MASFGPPDLSLIFISGISLEVSPQVLEYDEILRETWKQVVLPFSKLVMA